MNKLLILSSDTGEGHNSTARALEGAAAAAGIEVSVRKPAEESGQLNRKLGDFYNSLLGRRPQWMAGYFWLVNHAKPNESELMYRLYRRFISGFLDSERPDAVLSVHPMLNHLVQRFIKERQWNIPCYTLLTDPFPPFWTGWASPYVDRYFVPTDEALQALISMGIAPGRIDPVPMPVREQFRPIRSEDSRAFREELGLTGDTTIFINGGARGGGPIFEVYECVREASPEADILVACGHNSQLRERIRSRGDSGTRAFGYLEDIHRYLSASDFVLTKPGALSTYEAMACGIPMLLLGIGNKLMPQESGMFHAAARHGFGFTARTLDEVASIISGGPKRWRRVRRALGAFYQPSSGRELIDRIHAHHVHA